MMVLSAANASSASPLTLAGKNRLGLQTGMGLADGDGACAGQLQTCKTQEVKHNRKECKPASCSCKLL